MLKPQNLTDLPDAVLTLACGWINEVEEEVDWVVEQEKAGEEADNVKTITELFDEAYIQGLMY